MAKIGCNGRKIDFFYYSEEEGSTTSLRGKKVVPVSSSQTQTIGDLSSEEYNELEQKALAYLLKDAIDNAGGRSLIEVSGVKQDITYGLVNNHLEATLALRGIAIYN